MKYSCKTLARLGTILLCLNALSGCLSHVLHKAYTQIRNTHPAPARADSLATEAHFAALNKAGCHVYRHGEVLTVLLPTDQLFEPGTAKQLPDGLPVLRHLVALLQAHPERPIIIDAHTDEIAASAQDLHSRALQQAKQIAAYFWSQGILQNRLRIESWSNRWPIANPNTLKGRAANRRITVTMLPAAPGL